MPGRDEGAAGDHRAHADAGAVEHGGAVADQAFLAEPGGVHGAVVADGGAGADLDALRAVDVDDRAVLHVGAAPHDDRLEVGADDGVVPDRRALLDRHVADEDRGRRDERGRVHARRFPFEAEQWHEVVPRSMLEVPSSLVRRRRPEVTAMDICRGSPRSPPPRRPSASRRPSCCAGRLRRRAPPRVLRGERHRRPPPLHRPRALPSRRVGGRAERPLPARRPRARRGGAARGARSRAAGAPSDVDFLATTTCTGRMTPSLDAHLVARLGCRRDVQRVHVGDTGCASRDGGAAAGVESPARVPRSSRARARRRDLLGGLLPRRPAGERGGPRHLRRRRRRAGPGRRRRRSRDRRAPHAVPLRAPRRDGLRVPGRAAARDPVQGRAAHRRRR